MHWDISLVRFYKIQCIFYLYPRDEQNKQKFSQSRVTSANVHKIPCGIRDPVNILFLLNVSTGKRATGGQLETLERNS